MACSGCAQRRALIRKVMGRFISGPITREEIIKEARTWLGTPFQHQAHHKGIGCDCIGLVAGVALELGISGAEEWKDDPLMHQYGRPPQPLFLVRSCSRFLDSVDIAKRRLADILIMTFEKEPMHFALISSLEPLSVIHSLFSVGKVVEHRMDETWRARVRMCFGYRGIA